MVGKSQLLILVLVFFSLFGMVMYYEREQRAILEKRLASIENRLGGAKKLSCNESETVKKVRQSVVRIIGGEAEGSGFVITQLGYIVTNFHVIEFEPSPKVVFPDNTFETAEIVLADKDVDIAFLSVNKKMPSLSFGDPEDLQPAETLLALGYPLGGNLVGEASVTKSSLSGRRRDKFYDIDYLQIDGTFKGGVSGGPMVNVCGEVVGMNTAGTSGLGLAIASNTIRSKMLDILFNEDPLKDVAKITFEPNKSALDAVQSFYNYIKIKRMDKAFELFSDNIKKDTNYKEWQESYKNTLDTSILSIEEDEKEGKSIIKVKLSSKDLVEDEILYKYYEGTWEVRKVNDKWVLWLPIIQEVEDPDFLWFY